MVMSFSTAAQAKPFTVPQHKKIKVLYPNDKEFTLTEEIIIQVSKDFKIDEQLIIPEGSTGRIKITELMGSKQDKVKNAVGELTAVDGTEIKIQMKRPKKRRLLTLVSASLAVLDPISFVVGEIAAHKLNRTALKSSFYTVEDTIINLDTL